MDSLSAVNVRTDEPAERALAELTADGLTVSDAIRQALIDAVQLRRGERMRRESRPTIVIGDEEMQVLIEQTAAVAPERLGAVDCHVSQDELEPINSALRLALELD